MVLSLDFFIAFFAMVFLTPKFIAGRVEPSKIFKQLVSQIKIEKPTTVAYMVT